MYSIADIDHEIAALEEQRDYQISYWFEMGETDRDFDIPPKYPDNVWYMNGYEDRQYQLEISFIAETSIFNHY
ncbi:hypothetical protein [Nodularia sphaerocarpa]|uniref:hypothetical protein n=1 Tax=Nodularia sphaerocarpa TaxID=137816 RepID=UPI00232E5BEC|nr:hypothetical protein [Nodularia sphaerocarpa]MDB9373269.1 hypothetical protein [Nodularia sphaerocarpa CS-585]MDB9378422.1 hypothetical protein [Nodularia sphaerocarpa CS-585A2]